MLRGSTNATFPGFLRSGGDMNIRRIPEAAPESTCARLHRVGWLHFCLCTWVSIGGDRDVRGRRRLARTTPERGSSQHHDIGGGGRQIWGDESPRPVPYSIRSGKGKCSTGTTSPPHECIFRTLYLDHTSMDIAHRFLPKEKTKDHLNRFIN